MEIIILLIFCVAIYILIYIAQKKRNLNKENDLSTIKFSPTICSSCYVEISKNDLTCSNCGSIRIHKTNIGKIIVIALIILLFLVFIFYLRFINCNWHIRIHTIIEWLNCAVCHIWKSNNKAQTTIMPSALKNLTA